MDKIIFRFVCSNPSAIHLIEKNMDQIDWKYLSLNPSAIHILQQNQDKIVWCNLSKNPGIFELDYDFLKRRMNIVRDELLIKTWHFDRFEKWCL
jgi:hypothetical protein